MYSTHNYVGVFNGSIVPTRRERKRIPCHVRGGGIDLGSFPGKLISQDRKLIFTIFANDPSIAKFSTCEKLNVYLLNRGTFDWVLCKKLEYIRRLESGNV